MLERLIGGKSYSLTVATTRTDKSFAEISKSCETWCNSMHRRGKFVCISEAFEIIVNT